MESPFMIDALIGSVIARTGRRALIDFYTIMGRPEADVLRARADSVEGVAEQNPVQEPTANVSNTAGLRRAIIATVRDTTRRRSTRMETLGLLGLAPCTNVRELLFGSGNDVRAAFEQARQDLARFESERLLVDVMEDMPNRLGAPSGRVQLLGGVLGKISETLLGSDRIAGCTRLLTSTGGV